MLTNEERLIADAVQHAHLTKLPKPLRDGVVWLEAIAKIKLGNGGYGYGIVKRNYDLSYVIKYINGGTYPAMEIVEVYPYLFLDGRIVKKFKEDDTEEQRIAYLRSLEYDWIDYDSLQDKTIDELNKLVVMAAVYRQLKEWEAQDKEDNE